MKIGALPVLVAETLAIRNVLKQAIWEKYSKVIIDSDLLIAIHAMNGKSIPTMQVCNLIEDIIMLAKLIDNIKFVYFRRSVNDLANKIAKGTLRYPKKRVISDK